MKNIIIILLACTTASLAGLYLGEVDNMKECNASNAKIISETETLVFDYKRTLLINEYLYGVTNKCYKELNEKCHGGDL